MDAVTQVKEQNAGHFLSRVNIYLKERFNLPKHALLIAIFTFSAISYSIVCSNDFGFISVSKFIVTFSITFTLFLLLRLFDEKKDYEDDKKYRSYLPVPRGLISLKEIEKMIKWVIAFQCIIVLAVYPKMLPFYVLCLVYMLLMRVEFFIPEWLKERPVAYTVSHMVIIPLIDFFASAAHWLFNDGIPHVGLLFFVLVSFINGIVIEFGRKLRATGFEEEGVMSYSKLWGRRKATVIWIVVYSLTLGAALLASMYANHPMIVYVLIIIAYFTCLIPAIRFIKNDDQKISKQIENASGIWTVCMYALLGAGPMIAKLF